MRKKSKSTKVRERGRLLVRGEGIKLDEVMGMADHFLVGRVCGRNYTSTRLKKWVTEVWDQILEELSSVVHGNYD